MFHEDWYHDHQISALIAKAKLANLLTGTFIEVGCWEGKSTIAIAQAIAPTTLHAVDTWEGSTDENPNHATVIIAKQRDVYTQFLTNLASANVTNVVPNRVTWQKFFEDWNEPIAFLHIDGSHDYQSVRDNIAVALPFLLPYGIICGDDILTANSSRSDLNGGVERAVQELLPNYQTFQNFWFYQHPPLTSGD